MIALESEQFSRELRNLASQFGATNVRVFGSYASGTATADSDLDLLVDLEPDHDLLDLIGLKQELEARLGIRVDVVTTRGLSPHLRARLLKEARFI